MAQMIQQWPLQLVESQDLAVPRGSELLKVGFDRSQLWLWGLCDPDLPPVTITLHLVETNRPIVFPDPVPGSTTRPWRYLDTVIDPSQGIWHLWLDVRNKK